MIKHIWSVLCKKSIIDSETNNVTLSEVLEQINIGLDKSGKTFTAPVNILFDCEVVSMWVKNEKKIFSGELKIDFCNPKGDLVKDHVYPFEMLPEIKRLRTRIRFNGFPIEGAGVYSFEVYVREKGNNDFCLVSEIPMEVVVSNKASRV